jgi:hypothetical protein
VIKGSPANGGPENVKSTPVSQNCPNTPNTHYENMQMKPKIVVTTKQPARYSL